MGEPPQVWFEKRVSAAWAAALWEARGFVASAASWEARGFASQIAPEARGFVQEELK